MLFDLLEEVPRAQMTVDLAAQTVTLPTGQTVSFPIDGFSKTCLLRGTDELGYLLGFADQIDAFERATAQP
jgi:3-isopropylmalate/(R)-2-methylmalate dehydratase small subunit